MATFKNDANDVEIEITEDMTSESKDTEADEVFYYKDPSTDRYNTFRLMSWWKQEIVRNATIMVIGAGALGNEVLKNLALMGVGRILIVDFDYVDDSNLSRSILFRESDNGRKKAEVAADGVREINPDVSVQWLHADINHEIGLGIYNRMDVVIGCLDNREARLSINKACWHLNKPWVDGAIQELFGIARVFWPNKGACYECTLDEEDYHIMSIRSSCNRLAKENIIAGKVPTTPTISSIIAATQTQDALKLLHGMMVETGKAMCFNGLNNEVLNLEYKIKEECQSHYIYDHIVELQEVFAKKTTIAELLQIAKVHLGNDAMLEIPSYVTYGVCSNCRTQKEIFRPLYQVTYDTGHCENCGTLLTLDPIEYVSGGEKFLDRTLSQIGISLLDVVSARTPDWRYKYFELTGDAKTFFEFSRSTPETTRTFYERRLQWQKKSQ